MGGYPGQQKDPSFWRLVGRGQEGEPSRIEDQGRGWFWGWVDEQVKSRSVIWADLEWYLVLLPVGPWASYIMPLDLHSLVQEMG